MSHNLPNQIGPYEILNEIGRGGMSFVYRALDTRADLTVALKVLPTRHADDPAYIQRFVREGQNASRLSHPNIVQIFEAGEYEDYHTIAMELVEGGTLTDYLRGQWDLLHPQIPINVIRQLASGLDYAHAQGFLHRDMKPSNVLLSGDLHQAATRVLISDFGVARRMAQDLTAVTQMGFTVGTPNFMSPEQARGDERLDHRSDIYSLGAVAYVLFTGKMPFKADTQLALMHKVVYEAPTPPEELNPHIPKGVAYAIKRGLAKDPNLRFDSANELALALEDGLTWEPSTKDMAAIDVSAFPIQLAQSTIHLPVRKQLPWWIMSLAAISITVASILLLFTPINQWLFPPANETVSSTPIVLTQYEDPTGRFKLDVPDTWTQMASEDSVSFESTDFIGRLFVQEVELPAVQEPLQAALESYIRQPALPFKNLVPAEDEQALIIRENATARQYVGQWLGVDIVLRLVAIGVPDSQRAYIVGTGIDAAEQRNFGHLADAVVGTFTTQLDPDEDHFVEANSANATLSPTSTPLMSITQSMVQNLANQTPTTQISSAEQITTELDNSTAIQVITVTPLPATPSNSFASVASASEDSLADDSTASVSLGGSTASTNFSAESSSLTGNLSTAERTATAEALQVVVNQKLTSIASSLPPILTSTATAAKSQLTQVNTPSPTDGVQSIAQANIATQSTVTMTTTGAVTATATPLAVVNTPIVNVPNSTRIAPAAQATIVAPTGTANPTSKVTPTATRTPTITLTATKIALATATPIVISTQTPRSTATFTVAPTKASVPTATSIASSTRTPRPTATKTATALSAFTPTATALSTLQSTSTVSVQVTARPTQVSTITPTETVAAVPQNATVTLVEPLDGVLKGRYTFRWRSDILLPPGQLFELVFWEVGRDPIINGFGPVGAKPAKNVNIDLDKIADILPQLEPNRDYEWGILLVTESPYRRLRYLGGGHEFRFERSEGSSDTPTSTPSPRG